MFSRRYQALGILIVVLSILFIGNVLYSIQQRSDKTNNEPVYFVLASWSFPDEYGQGIYAIRIYENSTGSWVNVGGWIEYYETEEVFEWENGVAIKIQCDSTINATLTGASSSSEGKKYHRHSVTVTDRSHTVVFNQQNFTYLDDINYGYHYEVILNFLPVYGEYYTITIEYEVFW